MDNNVLRKIFTYCGIFPLLYDSKTDSYEVSKRLIIYTLFVILLTNIINVNGILSNYFDLSSNLYDGLGDETTGKKIVLVDFLCYMNIVCSTPILIFLKRQQLCKCINNILRFKQEQIKLFKAEIQTFQMRLDWIMYFLLLINLIAVPRSFTLYQKRSFYLMLIYSYFFSIHVILGQLFEFHIYKWLCFYFQTVKTDISKLKSFADIKFWIDKYEILVRICRKCSRIFGVLKVIHLTSANVLMSIYFFYNFDSVNNVFDVFLWQLMILAIYYFCHLWDTLTVQVSFEFFVLTVYCQNSKITLSVLFPR